MFCKRVVHKIATRITHHCYPSIFFILYLITHVLTLSLGFPQAQTICSPIRQTHLLASYPKHNPTRPFFRLMVDNHILFEIHREYSPQKINHTYHKQVTIRTSRQPHPNKENQRLLMEIDILKQAALNLK